MASCYGTFRVHDRAGGYTSLIQAWAGRSLFISVRLAIAVPSVDVVMGYRISDPPDDWTEGDRAYLEGGRKEFLEMVKDDVSRLMRNREPGLSDVCFVDCEETIPTWADLKRMETWRRAYPEIHGWHESPEVFLIVGVAATPDLDTASHADCLLEAFENLRRLSSDAEVALARVPAAVDLFNSELSEMTWAYPPEDDMTRLHVRRFDEDDGWQGNRAASPRDDP